MTDKELIEQILMKHLANNAIDMLKINIEDLSQEVAQALRPDVEAVERYKRAGEYLFRFAKMHGWKDDGEGAFEYVQRISYAQGLEDGTGRIEPDFSKVVNFTFYNCTAKDEELRSASYSKNIAAQLLNEGTRLIVSVNNSAT